jgi:cold shock CspA family protein
MAIPVQKTALKTSAATVTTMAAKTPATPALPDDFEVDKDARYSGTVTSYSKWRGFGHISIDQKGVVPGDSVFVHWKNIQTDDRFPRLKQDLKVEFGLMLTNDWKGWKKVKSVKAKTVTLAGGAMVNIQDEMDAEKKEFVGAQNFRYTGKLKFFDPFRGFGWVALDDGFALDEPVPKELKVEGVEINSGGKPHKSRLQSMDVEFGIQKNKKGDYLVYNMTLPGGHPITQESLENRQDVGGQKFEGTVSWFTWRQGWGHIAPSPDALLPPAVNQKLDEMVAAAAAKEKADGKPVEKLLYFRKADCEWGFKPEVGQKVVYTVYVDDKGAGAKDVASADAA